MKPVVLQGKSLARTWWGKAWNENLERYADYENRIGRGRSYVRHGAVLDLQIREGEIAALVQGSRAKPYEITITIKKLSKDAWKCVTSSCEGKIDSLAELLEGEFPKSMADAFMRQGTGLFPAPKEIKLQCSCPDWAEMCKHVAASLYGVGARLDEDPALFFTLRGVDTNELIGRTVAAKADSLLQKAAQKTGRIIDDSDITGMFGIELAGADTDAGVLKPALNKRNVRTPKRAASAVTGKPKKRVVKKKLKSKTRRKNMKGRS